MICQHTVATPYMVGDCHFYTTELAGELVLFDTGPPTISAWETLCREVDLSRLKHIFLTHWHIDHCGQVNKIQAASGATVYLSELDALKLHHQQQRLELLKLELVRMGFNAEFQQRLYEQGSHVGLFSEPPEHYQVLEFSPKVQQLGLDYLHCAGHSQSDLIFLLGESAISGDILLANIFQSPLLEIDLRTFAGRFDNYTAYCASLVKFRQLRGRNVLPGHRYSATRIDAVVSFYVAKLRERAAHLAQFAVGTPVSRIVATLFGDLLVNPVVTYLKASEVLFMQDYLARPHLLDEALTAFGLTEN
ncbi:MAG: MBL fold metallo-hydrolase [Desulfuromonadales bacterium]|nr:MBL fold metallo-hydrolase [Desulfuromonadales bacterium]MDT8422855.1 MBL fold metallo-hydrolase [Desulfuromonadales bacterium]